MSDGLPRPCGCYSSDRASPAVTDWPMRKAGVPGSPGLGGRVALRAGYRGSHAQYKHPSKPGLVTVAGSGGDDLAPGTLNSILKQAGLKGPGPSEAP